MLDHPSLPTADYPAVLHELDLGGHIVQAFLHFAAARAFGLS